MSEQIVELPLDLIDVEQVCRLAMDATGSLLHQMRHPFATRPFRKVVAQAIGIMDDEQRGNGLMPFFTLDLIDHVNELRALHHYAHKDEVQ